MAAHDAAGPVRRIVEAARLAGLEDLSVIGPGHEVRRRRVADAGMAMPQVWIPKRSGCVQVEQMERLAVVGEPEIPEPMVRPRESHDALPFAKWFQQVLSWQARCQG